VCWGWLGAHLMCMLSTTTQQQLQESSQWCITDADRPSSAVKPVYTTVIANECVRTRACSGLHCTTLVWLLLLVRGEVLRARILNRWQTDKTTPETSIIFKEVSGKGVSRLCWDTVHGYTLTVHGE
jgi:hypothetical protein